MTIAKPVKLTQNDQVLDYLREHGSVTPLEALHEFGCFRLGARIWDLKQRGHRIVTKLEEGDYPGQRFARYYLVGQQPLVTARSEPLGEQRPEATL